MIAEQIFEKYMNAGIIDPSIAIPNFRLVRSLLAEAVVHAKLGAEGRICRADLGTCASITTVGNRPIAGSELLDNTLQSLPN